MILCHRIYLLVMMQTLCAKLFAKFILETRNSNGEQYPPSTIHSLLRGLNHCFKENKAPFSVMSKEDPQFQDLSLTLDTVTSELHRRGIGAKQKYASVGRKC